MSHDDLRALFLSCTLKKRPERTRARGLTDLSSRITEKQGVQVEHRTPIDHGRRPDRRGRSRPLRISALRASAAPAGDFTNRNTPHVTSNLLHTARPLKATGGIPAIGIPATRDQRSEWDAGCRFDFENPQYR
ncbi:hypothetical protein [Streptomyces sp. NPDC007369]|uniref:hypothetical protein n=1 Tax=Streptomyces sp. NPDC007369 TaxID=3154589 RepID=UPI0033D82B0C